MELDFRDLTDKETSQLADLGQRVSALYDKRAQITAIKQSDDDARGKVQAVANDQFAADLAVVDTEIKKYTTQINAMRQVTVK